MLNPSRREFSAAALASPFVPSSREGDLGLATFRFDVTPPIGHSLCGGWIEPLKAVDDPLEAIGFVLLGAGKPIVVCAVDWTGILNDAHVDFCTALAEAAGTTADRVAVQTVHQHDAPFACLNSDAIIRKQGDLPPILDPDYFRRVMDAGRAVVSQAIRRAEPISHVAFGRGKVSEVAGNRRFVSGGKVVDWRGSSSKQTKHHNAPEGLIDPWLTTVAFYQAGQRKLACHYYACHPMSHYGKGRASSDFVGLARKRRQKDDPSCTHIYFTGCAGNVAAGKYNDGSPAARIRLTNRIHAGMLASELHLKPQPIETVRWTTEPLLPKANPKLVASELDQLIARKGARTVDRNRPAFERAWLDRLDRKLPIVLSALHVNDIALVHLPSESFVEYQLRLQREFPNRRLAIAAYGDGGPWYIPTASAYPEGGYEVSVAFCDASVDDQLMQGLRKVVG